LPFLLFYNTGSKERIGGYHNKPSLQEIDKRKVEGKISCGRIAQHKKLLLDLNPKALKKHAKASG
jgi:hypothetical protein